MAKVQLDGVSIDFPIYSVGQKSLKRTLLNLSVGGKLTGTRAEGVVIRALDNINIDLRDGDRLALIGHNGAGKTTLLRTIAGILEPEIGDVLTEGRIVSLFDLGLGIDAELTGYENIYLRGYMLGLDKRDLADIVPQIEEFTELADFLSIPVRAYSTGMIMRLAFAISTHVHPDILLMDEWLSTGDARFIDKAQRRLTDVVDRAKIMVLATHATTLARSVCNKAVLMDHGTIVAAGTLDEVIEAYDRANNIAA